MWRFRRGFNLTDNDVQRANFDTDTVGTRLFPNNWMHGPNSGSESFKMKIKSSSLMLVFKDSGNPRFGKADIYVDGKLVATADPSVINWTHCHALLLYKNEDSIEREIEIKMSPGNEDKNFTILGFGYVE